MSLLMDALRRVEAEKRESAAQRGAAPGDASGTNSELSLEPRETALERPMRVLESDEFEHDGRAVPPHERGESPAATPTLGTGQAGAARGGAAQPTLVTPQTIFEATRGAGIPRALLTVAVVTVLFIAGLGAVGLYAYRQLPPPPALPSPRIAAQIERQAHVPPPRAPTAPRSDGAATAELRTSSATPRAAPTRAPAPPPVAQEAPPPTARSAPSSPAAPVSRVPAEIPRDAEIASGEVRIAKRATGGVRVDDVTRAYGAFQLGKLELAAELYRRALARDPDRIDALLGLGAIALRTQRLDEARRHYRAVLRLAPRHAVASAALFLIEGGSDDAATEARLKLLADDDASGPYLHFALGNLYAGQRRWADAQQAYFAAFSGAPGNADYAYNLAVSLDQLGQRKAALDYYRKALELRTPSAVFDAARAHARVAALVAGR